MRDEVELGMTDPYDYDQEYSDEESEDQEIKPTDDILFVITEIVDEYGAQILQNKDEIVELVDMRLVPGRIRNIAHILFDAGIGEWLAGMNNGNPPDNQELTRHFCKKLNDEWGIDPEIVSPIIQKIQTGVNTAKTNRSQKFGKKICNSLKAMRRAFAEANGIEYEEEDCTNPNPCNGTCPYCEERTRYLLEAAERLNLEKDIIYPEIDFDPVLAFI